MIPHRAFPLIVALGACGARAQEAEPQVPLDEPPAWKLSAGAYRYPDAGNAFDVNLRNASSVGDAWIGYFRFPAQDVDQWRAGWQKDYGEHVTITPSAQVASGGFLGGSIQAQAGDPWFVAAAFGRTNLHPYYNLNFDPNDSYTVQAGYDDKKSGHYASVQLVRDNREHPDRRHVHFTWREDVARRNRLTLDALYKTGTLDDGSKVRRWGFTASYDWPRLFVVVACDPKSNFSPLDLWRFTIGMRF